MAESDTKLCNGQVWRQLDCPRFEVMMFAKAGTGHGECSPLVMTESNRKWMYTGSEMLEVLRRYNYTCVGTARVTVAEQKAREVMLANVTDDHIARAGRMIGCGLDVEQVSQWLATHDTDKAEIERLRGVMGQAAKTVEACGHTDICKCCWCKMRKMFAAEAGGE